MPDSLLNPSDSFALLDDCTSGSGQPHSRLYTELVQVLSCSTAAGMPAMLEEMHVAQAAGLHALGLFDYELGARMHSVHSDAPAAAPLARILLFRRCQRLAESEVDVWLSEQDDGAPSGIAGIQASVSEAEFASAIDRIHAYIEAGDTYQINFTYRLRFDAYGAPLALYRRLRARQPVPYGALIGLPDGGAILSLSPELFVRCESGRLTATPMKGTAPASGEDRDDDERAVALANDPKNRAENLMIVDLLRNDLGRIARTGSVQVPHLFQVQRYSSVLQMTSTITARLRENAGLHDVLAAIYPCGSITGAPKRRTMQIINELEPDPRGLYTGALGWFDPAPDGTALGDFCLSVPIRTLVLQPPKGTTRRGELGVGAGIVHDSEAANEFAECRLKARFLTGLGANFELIETMHATLVDGCRHVDLHLHRLRASAAYFNFAFDEEEIRSVLAATCATLAPERAYRLRLSIDCRGRCDVQVGAMELIRDSVLILLARECMRSDDLFLRHKTSVRARYDAAWREAERQGAFDTLFTNERSEITEGGRCNIFVRLDGRWFTPPLDAGVLPGVMRAVLLSDPAWDVSERSLSLDDLRRAEQLIVCNALRGVLPAQIVWDKQISVP